MATVLLTAGCTGRDARQDAPGQTAAGVSSFSENKKIADTLYSHMHFRDAYNIYLHLLNSEEANADSEKKLDMLNALSVTSELAGHKTEQGKWLEQLPRCEGQQEQRVHPDRWLQVRLVF
jgi:hypothetical protein